MSEHVTRQTCAAIERLGFRCSPLTEQSQLSAPFAEAVPNREARELLTSWAVFPLASTEPRIVTAQEVPVDGVLDSQSKLMKSARDAANAVGASRAVVRVPLLGLYVTVAS